MKVNLSKISKRALGFFENPQFLKSEITDGFQVTLDSSDKILTAFYSGNQGEIELIFSEALAIFSRNRTQNDLWKINFREFENFLRDENHLPAFAEDLSDLEGILSKIKISMIASLIKIRLGPDLKTFIETVSHWEKLTLAAKNTWARDFISALGWELIFCDEKTMTVTKAPEGVPNESLEVLIQKILGRADSALPMKVVAVQ